MYNPTPLVSAMTPSSVAPVSNKKSAATNAGASFADTLANTNTEREQHNTTTHKKRVTVDERGITIDWKSFPNVMTFEEYCKQKPFYPPKGTYEPYDPGPGFEHCRCVSLSKDTFAIVGSVGPEVFQKNPKLPPGHYVPPGYAVPAIPDWLESILDEISTELKEYSTRKKEDITSNDKEKRYVLGDYSGAYTEAAAAMYENSIVIRPKLIDRSGPDGMIPIGVTPIVGLSDKPVPIKEQALMPDPGWESKAFYMLKQVMREFGIDPKDSDALRRYSKNEDGIKTKIDRITEERLGLPPWDSYQ